MQRPLVSLMPALGVLLFLLAACGSRAPSDQDVLVSLTDTVIVPSYQGAAQDAAKLDQDVQALCNAPSGEALEAARHSWRAARASWMRSKAMWFGPVMDRRSVSLIDWSPTDTGRINQWLAEGAPVGPGEVRETMAANQRGFGAIEHLLFRGDALDSAGNLPSYCQYLGALAQVAREEAEAILSEWVDETEGQPPYQDYFTSRSRVAVLSSAAVAEVVRTQFFLIRDIVNMRFAPALGLREGGQDLSAIPGNAADNGLNDLRHELLGMQAIYEGAGSDGLGVSDLVLPLSEETDQRMRVQFAAAIQAIDSIEGPLRAAIAQRPQQVMDLYDSLLDLQRTMATEVVSLLGVSVGFTDTDGDSLR